LLLYTMPALQQLRAGCASPYQLACCVRGHPALRLLHLRSKAPGSASEWRRMVLSTLPSLCSFSLHSSLHNADQLMVDLAACQYLQRIVVRRSAESLAQLPYRGLTGTGVKELASAACRSSLRVLLLQPGCEWCEPPGSRLSLAEVLPLLKAELPQLAVLRVAVEALWEVQLEALAERLGRPVQVLQQQLMQQVEED
jgi:hypothetical protein